MKHTVPFALLLVLTLAVLGCKKDEPTPDYRDAYVGTYNVIDLCYQGFTQSGDFSSNTYLKLVEKAPNTSDKMYIGLDLVTITTEGSFQGVRLPSGGFNIEGRITANDSIYYKTLNVSQSATSNCAGKGKKKKLENAE